MRRLIKTVSLIALLNLAGIGTGACSPVAPGNVESSSYAVARHGASGASSMVDIAPANTGSRAASEVLTVHRPGTRQTLFMRAINDGAGREGRPLMDGKSAARRFSWALESSPPVMSRGNGHGGADGAGGDEGGDMGQVGGQRGSHGGALGMLNPAKHLDSLRNVSAFKPIFALKDRYMPEHPDEGANSTRRFVVPFFGFDNQDKRAWHQPAVTNIPDMRSMVDDPNAVTPAQNRYFAGYRLGDPRKSAALGEWYLAIGMNRSNARKPATDGDQQKPLEGRGPAHAGLGGSGPVLGVVGKF